MHMCSVIENAGEVLIKELIIIYKGEMWPGFFKFIYWIVNFL